LAGRLDDKTIKTATGSWPAGKSRKPRVPGTLRGMEGKALILLALAGAACSAARAAPPHTHATSFNVYATLTSDYRERGLSQSGGDPALLLGLDYQQRAGFSPGSPLRSADTSKIRTRATTAAIRRAGRGRLWRSEADPSSSYMRDTTGATKFGRRRRRSPATSIRQALPTTRTTRAAPASGFEIGYS
jgi:hypothetical protein